MKNKEEEEDDEIGPRLKNDSFRSWNHGVSELVIYLVRIIMGGRGMTARND